MSMLFSGSYDDEYEDYNQTYNEILGTQCEGRSIDEIRSDAHRELDSNNLSKSERGKLADLLGQLNQENN